jgi:hypothetical protein
MYRDSIDYMQRREHITFLEAKRMVENDDSKMSSKQQVKPIEPTPTRPGDTWQARGWSFVAECKAALWSDYGKAALSYLHSRHLSDDILDKYNVGLNERTCFEDGKLWGYDGEKVTLEKGIIFPAIAGELLYYIKIRKPTLDPKEKKYVQVRGSRPGIFGFDNLRGASIVVFTEGEIDCMSFDQAAGDLAAPITFGSAQASPGSIEPGLVLCIMQAPHKVIIYDNDEAGSLGAMGLQEKIPSVLVASLPDNYKDINEYHAAGNDLGKWFSRECERLGLAPTSEEWEFDF